jgi:hypothetical protein
MSVVLPRLDRASALELLEQRRGRSISEISREMPDRDVVVTYSPVGGNRIDVSELAELRSALVKLAQEHGMPAEPVNVSAFEAAAARLIHDRLDITPHEASQEGVWSYLTCCWLLDLAVWRFGANANTDRFIGHLNRNTFRRMWWRAEVLGPDVDLAQLGEDELVNIMERPTLFSDRRLARAIALEQIDRVGRGAAVDRMRLMREATKRLLRLTPFVAFSALELDQVKLIVSDAFNAAAAGLTGEQATMPARPGEHPAAPSGDVVELPRLDIAVPSSEPPESLVEAAHVMNFDEVAEAAMDIARRTGRVTNMALREVVPFITSEEAREVLHVLVQQNELARRGVKRGTHYIIPVELDGTKSTVPAAAGAPAGAVPRPPAPPPQPPVGRPRQRAAETALRRLLRRTRSRDQ